MDIWDGTCSAAFSSASSRWGGKECMARVEVNNNSPFSSFPLKSSINFSFQLKPSVNFLLLAEIFHQFSLPTAVVWKGQINSDLLSAQIFHQFSFSLCKLNFNQIVKLFQMPANTSNWWEICVPLLKPGCPAPTAVSWCGQLGRPACEVTRCYIWSTPGQYFNMHTYLILYLLPSMHHNQKFRNPFGPDFWVHAFGHYSNSFFPFKDIDME